jgi:hypothetical protein
MTWIQEKNPVFNGSTKVADANMKGFKPCAKLCLKYPPLH